jgi:transposase
VIECVEFVFVSVPGAGWDVYDVELEILLPQLAAVRIEGVQVGTELIRILARTRDGVSVACPGCGLSSDWLHSRYIRHVADEAVGGRPVVIDLSVRRLYCENPVGLVKSSLQVKPHSGTR